MLLPHFNSKLICHNWEHQDCAYTTQIQFYKEIHQFNSSNCDFSSLLMIRKPKKKSICDRLLLLFFFLFNFSTEKRVVWEINTIEKISAVEYVCPLLFVLNETFWNENLNTDDLKLLLWNSLVQTLSASGNYSEK